MLLNFECVAAARREEEEYAPVVLAPRGAPVEEAGGAGGTHGVHVVEWLAALEQLVTDHGEAVHVSLPARRRAIKHDIQRRTSNLLRARHFPVVLLPLGN